MPTSSVTIIGNVTRDPELRFTASGQATASFGVAVNRRWQNRQTNEWEEAVSFYTVVAWRNLAENAAESLHKGTRVVVTGRLEQRAWETPDGQKRTQVEIVADGIGPDLNYASCHVTKNERRYDMGSEPTTATRPPAAAPGAGAPPPADYSYDEEPF